MLKKLASFAPKRKVKKMASLPNPVLDYKAPSSLDEVPTELVSVWTPPHSSMSSSSGNGDEEECSICLDTLSTSDSVVIKGCSHGFHSKCLNDSFKRERKCPVCRKDIPVRNLSPSGCLRVESIPSVCPGFDPLSTSIQLTYVVPSGIQSPYHDNPGQSYRGTTRVAYLPDNQEGRELLARMQLAWMSGLTFRIGTSATTGRNNAIIWTTAFDHKTSLTGGPFGFPDSGYISRTHRKLSDIGLPNSALCPAKLQQALASQASSERGTLAVAARSTAPGVNGFSAWTPPAVTSTETIRYTAPRTICQANSILTPDVVETLPMASGTETCPICFEELSTELSIRIKSCSHSFHQQCIKRCFRSEAKCPVCRVQVGKLQGKCPSGTMTITPPRSDLTGGYHSQGRICPGFVPQCQALEINYNIPSGRQESYHDHPSARFGGTNRTAYLPTNEEGLRVLLRLKYAWSHGMTFAVGTSMTTGISDQVVWTSIHHKTSLHGGIHGFPDPNYISNVNGELDSLGVPDAESCFSEL